MDQTLRSTSGYRSNSPNRLAFEEADQTIHTLKKELAALRYSSKSLLETRGKLSNLEHRYDLLVQDRLQEHERNRVRDLQNDAEITKLEADVREAREKLTQKERDITTVRILFTKLNQQVESQEQEITILNKRLNSEIADRERYLATYAEYEFEKNNILNDQLKCNTISAGVSADIEASQESLTRGRRAARELRSKMVDVNGGISSIHKELKQLDEQLAGLEITQRSKESQLKRVKDRAANIENEIQQDIKARDGLYDLYQSREDVFRSLNLTRNELTKIESNLSRDKASIEGKLGDAEKEAHALRRQVEDEEEVKRAQSHELLSLKKMYQRLAEENATLVQTLKRLDQLDAAAVSSLQRTEKIDNIAGEASKEIAAWLGVIRG